MSPIVALRSRHSLEGLPPLTSDEELIARSQSLVRERADFVVDISEPPPLRAANRASRAARADNFITAEEIFDEIRERVNSRT